MKNELKVLFSLFIILKKTLFEPKKTIFNIYSLTEIQKNNKNKFQKKLKTKKNQ